MSEISIKNGIEDSTLLGHGLLTKLSFFEIKRMNHIWPLLINFGHFFDKK